MIFYKKSIDKLINIEYHNCTCPEIGGIPEWIQLF